VTVSSEVGLGGLTARIACLAAGEILTIAEFRADEVRRWRIRVDRRGIPRVGCKSASWAVLRRDGALSEPALTRFLAPDDATRLLLARDEAGIGSLDADRALRMTHGCYRGTALLTLGSASVDEQVDKATARIPLSQWYELYVLERDRSGRLEQNLQQLFEPGARRGDTRTLRVHCEPSGPAGTTFAVVARDGPDYSWLVSTASVKVSPGRHTMTATLRRPGVVSFGGLPAPLREDTRSWADILATVPERVGELGPAHFILAVEACGPASQVAVHLDRAAQLVGRVAGDAEYPVGFSLLAYGAHPHNLRVNDDPVEVLARAQPAERVLDQLSALGERAGTRQDHYTLAASIECMLGQVAELLRDGKDRFGQLPPGARPVLVTVGSRCSFPAWQDPETEIVPCPAHLDWRGGLRALQEDHRGMTFGAICGGDRDAEVWRLLGADAIAGLIVFDACQFAANLRLLRPPGEHVPFPLVDR
jgi:hypothetical protein